MPNIFARHFRVLLVPFFLLSSSGMYAQLCNGSLGDPVVNITFGGNGANAPVSAPGYMFTGSSCPDDGYYTVTNMTSSCFGNTWHTVSSDHTGGGSFMLVNASFTPGDFFVSTVTDLCPNTTYEFASWIMNVMKPDGIKPNITFSIETPSGTVLKTFNTGNIPSLSAPQWKQYGFFFVTPSDNAVIVLRMTNNAPGGYGNDLALDDITFRPCGPMISAKIQGNASDTVNICEGVSGRYTFNSNVSSGYSSPVYQWQQSTDMGVHWTDISGATSTSYICVASNTAGNYWYRLTIAEAGAIGIAACRIGSNIVVINVHAKPVVNAGPDRVILPGITGNSVTLNGEATGEGLSYLWSPDMFVDDVHSLTPEVSTPSEINYTLTATSAFGCTNEDNVIVKVVTGIYIPSAFTPNNDGKNDSWTIPFLDPTFRATVNVFNRYGQVVYHSTAEVVNWNGKLNGVAQASGVYVYVVTFPSSKMNLKGTVVLIR